MVVLVITPQPTAASSSSSSLEGGGESAAFLSPERGWTYGRVRAAAELSYQTWFPSNTLEKEECSNRKKVNIIKIKVLKITLTTTVSFWIRRFVRATRSFHLLHYICPLARAGVNYTWSRMISFPNVKVWTLPGKRLPGRRGWSPGLCDFSSRDASKPVCQEFILSKSWNVSQTGPSDSSNHILIKTRMKKVISLKASPTTGLTSALWTCCFTTTFKGHRVNDNMKTRKLHPVCQSVDWAVSSIDMFKLIKVREEQRSSQQRGNLIMMMMMMSYPLSTCWHWAISGWHTTMVCGPEIDWATDRVSRMFVWNVFVCLLFSSRH